MPLDEPPPSRQPPRFVPTLTEIFVPAGGGSNAPDQVPHDSLSDVAADHPAVPLLAQPDDSSEDQSYLDRSIDYPVDHTAGASSHQANPPSSNQVAHQAAYEPGYQSTSQPVNARYDQAIEPGFRAPLSEERSVYLPDTAVIELLARMGPELDARLSETIAHVLHEQMPILNARIRQAVAEVVRETVAKAAANPERR
ncbi:MAG: hypothetical protein I8H77_14355 [Comamonadaceae bacterium]|nr:hypothetical protein [Comamonadaceae bacterium]